MGDSTKGQAPYQLLRRGLAMVPEGRGVFARMTVTENLQMGAFVAQRQGGDRRDIERDVCTFSPPQGARPPARRHTVGRRTADACDGARTR